MTPLPPSQQSSEPVRLYREVVTGTGESRSVGYEPLVVTDAMVSRAIHAHLMSRESSMAGAMREALAAALTGPEMRDA